MSFDWIQEKDPLLVYIADPMCSWCYGFAPEITQVKEQLTGYQFKLVMGGLRPYGTETIKSIGGMLRHHWEEVGKASGQPFQFDLLDKEGFVYNTEPACRAVVTARKIAPDKEFDYFKAAQKAFYFENKDTNQSNTFLAIAESLEIDRQEFSENFESEDIRYETRTDFQVSAEMGIRGFPSVILRHKGQFFLVANGYRKAEDLWKVIEKIQSE